ncbi:MAG TPA: ABC transporter ATP-binding protein [Alphaproteobacteria bacterium]|nr:ABC transporter ATP-binding protein [Alphaproteobacteria bacterium]
MLRVENITTYYGASQALFGMSLEANEGEVVTLMGRNGMGKTTTVRSIIGFSPAKTGRITFDGQRTEGWPAYRVAQAGIGLVPEGRQIFPNLSVHENLLATAANRRGVGNAWTLERVYELFPRLAERRNHMGNQISGGEQQMLAIGRALATNPKLLILDEATEGLAPLVQEEIWRVLKMLKSDGQSILVIDKDVEVLMELADRHYFVQNGRVEWSGTTEDLHSQPEVIETFLGI